MASETGLLYSVVAIIDSSNKKTFLDAILNVSETVVNWSHEPNGIVPSFVPRKKLVLFEANIISENSSMDT